MPSLKYQQMVIFNICIFTLGLEINLSAKDYITWSGSNIIQTAKSIKKITNDIFILLKLNKSKSNKRLKQNVETLNNFSSVTAKEDENLHQISIASRVDNSVGNVSHNLVDVINEVLSEEPGNNTEESKHDDLQVNVDHFLNNLEYLKNNHSLNTINYDIDYQILQLMRSEEHDVVTKEYPDDDYDSSDNEHWRSDENARRIYKGENTKIRHFPFMASIHVFNNFQCGGSIIKSDLIVTAASCLQLAYNNRFFRENPSFLSVRIGSNYYVGGGESIEVLEVYFYPDYDPKSLNNNIAIMRLRRRIKFRRGKSRVKKIKIDRCAHGLPETGIMKGITIVGWGAKGVSNVLRDPWNTPLSFAVLGAYDLKDCQDVYSKKYVTKRNFCVGFISKGAGACSGDVGGPGIIAGKLAGIISFGSPRCGTPNAPTVFTKVGYYADWIDEIMEQDVRSRSRITTTTTTTHFTVPPKPTTFVVRPIFIKKQPFKPLRTETNLVIETNPEKDDLGIEEDNLFKEFVGAMFESNEVDEENLLDIGKEAKREQIKKFDKQKKITTTPALESDSETTIHHGWDESSDDEEHKRKATRSYQTTTMVEEYNTIEYVSNELPLIDDHEVIGGRGNIHVEGDTQADGDNLDDGDKLEEDRDILEDIIKLIDNLDISSEKDIDKLLANIYDERHNLESFKEDKKLENRKSLNNLPWEDKHTVENIVMRA